MRRSAACSLVLLLAASAISACRGASSDPPVLIELHEARDASPGREVRLRARLSFHDPASASGYLQDGDSGLYFEAVPGTSVPGLGRGVEVEGVMLRRGTDPILRAVRFRDVPASGPTPAPRRVPAAALADSDLAGTWVASEGVVTEVAALESGHALRIEGDGRTFTMCIAEARPDRPPGRESIVGFRVRAQGVRVAGADAGAARAGCTLRAPTRLSLRFLRDAPTLHERPATPLVTIESIRGLSLERARERRPVRVRGVVTTHHADEDLLFVQDASAGIYVEAWRHLHDVKPGQYVEVVGWTGPGAFAPVIDWPELRVLGTAPFPAPVRLAAAIEPQYDSQWIEIDGVVRSARLGVRRAILELAAFGERIRVDVPGITDLARVQPFVDGEVRLRGVYRTRFSTTRQLVAVEIHAPGLDFIEMLDPAPRDPYSAPLRRSDTVLEFHPQSATGRRIHVRGVVALHRPGRFLYMHDSGGPLRVESADAAALAPGDEVDVVGFPAPGQYRPLLLDASYRKRGEARSPEARDVTAEQAMSGELEGALIRIEGRLIEPSRSEGETRLLLRTPLYVFEAALAEHGPPSGLDALRPGSLLRVTGIGVLKGDEARVPQSLQLLMRSADDVVVVQNAPWWTPQRVGMAGAVLLTLAAGSLVWVATLRRRVHEQTEVLRRRLAREVALEERARLARDLHDTLEQNLAGIGYALEAVKHTLEHPSLARAHLDRALGHVDQSMGDARRSVWALRPHAFDHGDLVSALATLSREITRGGVARADVHVEGAPWPLQPGVEDHLFRIGQEALTNALKHAAATRLRIDLCFGDASLELRVQDDGRGFGAPAGAGGRLGLAGMRERVESVGGVLEVRSEAGRGTTISVVVPREAAAAVISEVS